MVREAKSLTTLRQQLNKLFPTRNTVSDGGEGDKKHKLRKSDHNPNAKGVYQARDFTHDPKTLDCHKLAEVLFKHRDPRIKYLIWNRRITKPDFSGWKSYTGANAHDKHLHISVNNAPALYDDSREWDLTGLNVPGKQVSAVVPQNKPNTNLPQTESTSTLSDNSITEQSPDLAEIEKPAPVMEMSETQTFKTESGTTELKSVQTNEQPLTEKTEQAPPKDGATATATKVTFLGIAVPTFILAIVETIKGLIAQGYVSAADVGNAVLTAVSAFVREHTRYVFYLAGGIIAILIIKKVFKQVTFLIQMVINANPRWHDVKIVPFGTEIKKEEIQEEKKEDL